LTDQKRLEPKRTVLTIAMFVAALVDNWRDSLGRLNANFAAMMWAKLVAETSNFHLYNFNFGNVRSSSKDGFAYHCLRGVWEGFEKRYADSLVASGQAVYEANEARIAAVRPKVAVAFVLGHPFTRFRAYESLDQAMAVHLALVEREWPAIVQPALEGDVDAFAAAMARERYMTAKPVPYAAAMRPHFGPARRSPEIAGLDLEDVDPTEVTIVPDHGTHAIDYTRALREEMLRARSA